MIENLQKLVQFQFQFQFLFWAKFGQLKKKKKVNMYKEVFI
jgi:hypothetical protein